MKKFKEFCIINESIQISEELHKHLQSILDEPDETSDFSLYSPRARKLARFSQTARKLLKGNQETGLESDKPKKGSSRAVFFPSDHKPLTVDGVPTKAKTVVKIAFPGVLDRYAKKDERMLGEHQNEAESDHYVRNRYGMLRENDDGTHSTNHDGILAPVFSNHPDHHHLEMGHVSPIKKSDFPRLTKHPDYPKGIKFDDMYHALNKEFAEAHGHNYHAPAHHTDEHHDHIMQHPFVQKAAELIGDTGFHPGDIRPANMGIWTHPVTGKEHAVMSDYGYSNDIMKEYSKRRARKFEDVRRKNGWG